MDKYQVVELVGEGSFGRVFRGFRRSDKASVALKLIPKLGHTEKELNNLRSECKIQMSLCHPNIVRMVDAFETPKEVVAVAEFVPGGDLHRLSGAKGGGGCDEETVRRIAGHLMSALHYLHSRRVLHRDLKPANVLLGRGGVAKICDFGFARHLGLETLVLTSIKGTPLYMAPELIEERPYDHTADLWSAGAILYELAVGHPPFPTHSLFQLIKKIRYESVSWPSRLPAQMLGFLRGLLEKDPKKRSDWSQILPHPFLEGVLNVEIDAPEETESLTRALSESQELAKEIQRQDKSRLLPGGSQTLIMVAQKYEERKRWRRNSEPVSARDGEERDGSSLFKRRHSFVAVEERGPPEIAERSCRANFDDGDFVRSVRERTLLGEEHLAAEPDLLDRLLPHVDDEETARSVADVLAVFLTCCDRCRAAFGSASVAQRLVDPIANETDRETFSSLVQILTRLVHGNLHPAGLDLWKLLELDGDRLEEVFPAVNRWLSRFSRPSKISSAASLSRRLASAGSRNALLSVGLLARLDKDFAALCQHNDALLEAISHSHDLGVGAAAFALKWINCY